MVKDTTDVGFIVLQVHRKTKAVYRNVCTHRRKSTWQCRNNVVTQIIASTGRKVFDYNQYNVLLLENQIQRLADRTFELHLENAALQGELKYYISKMSSV